MFLNTAPSISSSPKLSGPTKSSNKEIAKMHVAMPNYRTLNLQSLVHPLVTLPMQKMNLGSSIKLCRAYSARLVTGTTGSQKFSPSLASKLSP